MNLLLSSVFLVVSMSERENAVVRHCSTLGRIEFSDFVDQLGNARDLLALRAIIRSDLNLKEYAACAYCRALEGKRAIAFVRSFPVGSELWRHACYGLANHKREIAIPYMKEASKINNAEVRYLCYAACISAGWDDLLPMARADSNDQRAIRQRGAAIGDTLGKMASAYISHFETK